MTRTTNARVAGATFLIYIVAGVSGLAGLASNLLANVVLSLIQVFSALTLAVTLYAITRDEDPDLAMLGLTCRVGEGLVGVPIFALRLALSSGATSADAPGAAAASAARAILSRAESSSVLLSATLFAVGSTLFCWLLLRGRMIPAALAWLGVLASVLLVVVLPVQLAGMLKGAAGQSIWIPMAVFEVMLAVWLIVKGVDPPMRRQPA
jgi:uncharacterized protein DUF4386